MSEPHQVSNAVHRKVEEGSETVDCKAEDIPVAYEETRDAMESREETKGGADALINVETPESRGCAYQQKIHVFQVFLSPFQLNVSPFAMRSQERPVTQAIVTVIHWGSRQY